MEMLSSLRGDKHVFCLVVIKFKHVRSCPSFNITYSILGEQTSVVVSHQQMNDV